MKKLSRNFSQLRALMAFVAFVGLAAVTVSGCATFGIGNQPQDQVVLEAAAGLMVLEYVSIRDMGLSKAEIAHALLYVGDAAVQSQGYISFAALVQSRISDVTNGKLNPQVLTIYMLTIAVLEELEEDA